MCGTGCYVLEDSAELHCQALQKQQRRALKIITGMSAALSSTLLRSELGMISFCEALFVSMLVYSRVLFVQVHNV